MRMLALACLAGLAALPARPAEPRYDWVLFLHNGDTVHCRLQALAGGRLTVAWEVAPDDPLVVELGRVARVARVTEDEAGPPPQGDTLHLRDGSTLFGHAVKFGPKTLEFELPPLGRLVVDTRDVLELTRGKQEVPRPDMKEGEYAIVTSNGNVLTGRLDGQALDQLTLTSDGMTATVAYASVAAMFFPFTGRDDAAGAQAETAVPGVQVLLRNGSLLSGKEPRLVQNALVFRLGNGHEVRAPLDELAQISFLDYGARVARPGLRAVLVWGGWADPKDEFQKTLAILEEHFEDRWRISTSMAKEFDVEFRRKLLGARTLVIPEMEKLRAVDPLVPARTLKPLLGSFVRGGGNVVILGVQAQHLAWIKEAGLFDLSVVRLTDGKPVTFTPEGAGVGKDVTDWRTVNATFAYRIKPGIVASALATTPDGAVVVGRRYGRGWFLCIGADYYQTNDTASKVLINAVTLK